MHLHIQRLVNEIEAGRAGHGGGERRCRKGWVVRRRPGTAPINPSPSL